MPATLTLLATLLFFANRRLLTWLRFYQQEEYDTPRFLNWWCSNKLFDKKATFGLLVFALLYAVFPWLGWLVAAAINMALVALKEANPTKTGKKKLVRTARANRILRLAQLGLVFAMVGIFFIPSPLWQILAVVAVVQFLPVLLGFGNSLLSPWEKHIQKRYWQEAHDIIRKLKPITIGITGSFGKTSLKHILGHILTTQAPTLITPGSVNTPMGIARIVRERLTPDHRYFLAEMGAYGPGSIARLCALTNPNVAVITAVGHAHYERFKTLETVAKTKFELAEAVRANNGQVIFNADLCRFDNIACQLNESKKSKHWISCNLTPNATTHLPASWVTESIEQTNKGLKATVKVEGKKHVLEAPLFGTHQAGNMVLAAATAHSVGVPLTHIKTALKSTPQIPHRHEVKPQGNGTVLIDNGYNSNPAGFKVGLELLTLLKPEGGRRILITPGMIELGPLHEETHADVGTYAAQHADVVLAIAPQRIPSFTAAYMNASKTGKLFNFATFEKAQNWLNNNMRKGDVILIENDLPDLFEQLPRL